MRASHLIFLVEEPSMEACLQGLLPRLIPDRTFQIQVFQGKQDLLSKLPARLKAYKRWLPADHRLIALVDRDQEDCCQFKDRMEAAASAAGFICGTASSSWQVVNRIAVEELEAWYFGDWVAVRSAYPKVTLRTDRQSSYADPDAISGGTWEAFERILQRHGYFTTGLRKIEAGRTLGALIDWRRSKSASFKIFCTTVETA
jgi:hypothetical protein